MRVNGSKTTKKGSAPAARRANRVSTAPAARAKSPGAPKETPAVRPDEDQIRVRAYELSLERGHHGDPLEDWLRAERELLAQTLPPATLAPARRRAPAPKAS